MLLSFAIIFLFGLLFSFIFSKCKIPGLIGMLLTGIIFGPYFLNFIDIKILNISSELRQIALVIILTRAGLNLHVNDLKKIGRPAILMSFLPAICEIIGIIIITPNFFNINHTEALILGTVIAAVSPAVIVPKMIHIKESGYGKTKKIPELILASASVDDIFVIMLFTIATGIATTGAVSWITLLRLPESIIAGIFVGYCTGWGLSKFFHLTNVRDTIKAIIILSISFILIAIESYITPFFSFSALLAIMAVGMTIVYFQPKMVQGLSHKFSKLWLGAEILLFVLVGTTLDLSYLKDTGIKVVVVILIALCFRMIGVVLSLVKTPLLFKERIFCLFSYIPKATVQAAIGAIPLSMGLPCGKIVLTLSIASIIITAPLGAFLIELFHKILLKKE